MSPRPRPARLRCQCCWLRRNVQSLVHRAPLEQGEVRSRVLEGAGLLDHPVLAGARVRLHRDPSGLLQDHHEQRRGRQQVRGPDHLPGTRPHRRREGVGQVGAGQQRHGEHHEQHDRLGDRGERLGTARPELRVRAARLQRRGRHHEAGQRQQEPAAQDVAHVPERQPVGGQHRDRQVRRDRRDRRRQEEPARADGGERLLAAQLRQVVIRLQQLDDGDRDGRAHRATPGSLPGGSNGSSIMAPPTHTARRPLTGVEAISALPRAVTASLIAT